MSDSEIDTSEIPELGDEFFAGAELRMPEGKVPIMLSIDEDIVEWFRNQQGDLGRNLMDALRSYTESHR